MKASTKGHGAASVVALLAFLGTALGAGCDDHGVAGRTSSSYSGDADDRDDDGDDGDDGEHDDDGGDDGAVEGPMFVADGYVVMMEVDGLDFPTALDFLEGDLIVAEAGFMEPDLMPMVRRIGVEGRVHTLLDSCELPEGVMLGPLTDVTVHGGWVWVTHRQIGANGWKVGAISRFSPSAPLTTFQTVITNLPAAGDHTVNEIAFDEAGRAYFAIGTATNSAVVGPDNQWLAEAQTFHDYPPVDVALAEGGYESLDPRTSSADDTTVTAPYRAFGSGPVEEGTVVAAATPASPQDGIIAGTGTVYSFDPDAADPVLSIRLEAWGMRNPYGLGLDPLAAGQLYVINNGADVRGSRPIANDWDDAYVVQVGGDAEFFGFPDWFHDPITGDVLPITDSLICDEDADPAMPLGPGCRFALSASFRQTLAVGEAFAQLEHHSSANKFDFSVSDNFGHLGDLFVAETGSIPGFTGATELVGFKVVRVDRSTGEVVDFVGNLSQDPDELFDPDLMNKPIDVRFMRASMYVVDFGIFEPALGLAEAGSGKIWIVQRCDDLSSLPGAMHGGDHEGDGGEDDDDEDEGGGGGGY